MKRLIAVTLITLVASAQAFAKSSQDLSKGFDSLGGNQEIMARAKALDPQNRVQVVQNRAVDRTNRIEFGMSGSMIAGGDPYLSSYNYGLLADYHITPRFSVGARYYRYANDLTSEGKNMYDEANRRAQTQGQYEIVQIDYPTDTYLATVSFYPIYGKMNLFNSGIAQFDLYTIGGYGKVRLTSGLADTFTAGAGVGLWMTQHFTSRLEMRWQGYQDQMYTGARNLNLLVATLSVGYML